MYLKSLDSILVQQISLGHFDEHFACTQANMICIMHEHGENMPKYTLKCHKGPTQMQQYHNKQNPIKDLARTTPNFEKQPKISKIPNYQNPNQ